MVGIEDNDDGNEDLVTCFGETADQRNCFKTYF